LITASGINYGALLEKRISHLLPIKILGHQQFFELSALSAFCNHKLTSPDPFLVLNAKIENSQILLKENNIPIIFERGIAMGKIVFLSFDFFNPPFSRWAYNQIFWDRLLSIGPTPLIEEIVLENRTVQRTLLSKMPVNFPSFKPALAFVVFYMLFIGLYHHKARHRIDNKLKYGGYLVILIAVFTVTSHMAFFFPHNRKNLTHNSFALIKYSGQDRIASIKQMVGLYCLRESPYDVRFGSVLLPVTHLITENQSKDIPNIYLFHDDNFGLRITGHADKWSSNFFVTDSKIAFPGVADGFEDEQGLGIVIRNKLPHNIMGCWGYVNGRYFLFGDILSNTTQTKRILRSDRVDKATIEHQMTSRFGDLSKEILQAVQFAYQSRKNTVCLVGWIPHRLIRVEVAKSHDAGKSLSLLQWEIPVKIKDEV
jgi:hypothetical protein